MSRTRYELIQTFIAEAGENLELFGRLLAVYGGEKTIEDQNYELYRLAHSVRGSALSLGLVNTAQAARIGEHHLQDYLFESTPIEKDELAALDRWSKLLKAMIMGYETGDLSEIAAIEELEKLFATLERQPGDGDDD